MSDHEPQDPPKSGNIEVAPEVIADLKARSEMGRAKYRTVLKSMNGRSALTDLYQELLDGACYIKQRLIEESQDIPELIEESQRLRTLLLNIMADPSIALLNAELLSQIEKEVIND
jgi:hypothetical protein